MIPDGLFNWPTPAITNSNTETISTNATDVGSAKKVFGAEGGNVQLFYSFLVSVDCTSVEIKVLGDTTAATLDTGGEDTEIIASKTVDRDVYGARLGAGTQRVQGYIDVNQQRDPMRYYGSSLKLGGTNPDATAGKSYIVRGAQTNLAGA